MAHNLSRSKKAAYVRGNPLAEYRGFLLTCSCARCRSTRQLSVDAVLAVLGRRGVTTQRVGDVVTHLRCAVCGEAPAGVVVTNGARMSVPVKGPGAV